MVERTRLMRTALERSVSNLSRAPIFASTATLTIALGIALVSATAVIARAIAFAGLPVRDADRVVVLWGIDRAGSFLHLPLAAKDVDAAADAMGGIGTVTAGDYNGAYAWPFFAPDGSGPPLRLRGTLAGGNYFDVLGAQPVLGRALRPDDDVIGAARVLVLSHAAWRRHFASDPAVIGRPLRSVIWGVTYTIVGVMPPGLDVPRGVEFWTAFSPTAARTGSLEESWFGVDVIVRLAPGATAEQARQALTRFYATLARQGRVQYAGARATVRTLPNLVAGDVRPAFTMLVTAAAVVFLVTCANITGLLLVRASGRRRELAVRAALGADRRHLASALLIELALMAVVGALLGAVIAVGIVGGFTALAPADLPRLADLGVDWSLFLVVAAATALVAFIVGIGPAIAAGAVPPAAALGGGRVGAGGSVVDTRARRLLVGAQVALAFTVLAGAALVGRSLARLTTLDLGVAAPERLSFVELIRSAASVASPGESERTRVTRWFDRQDELVTRVRATPGVIAVAPVVAVPYAGAAGWDARLEPEGAAPEDSARHPYLNMEITNADYLRVTGTKLVRGRWIAVTDREDAPPVVVLSERAARALYPNENAVGRRVGLWRDRVATIVGVVGDTRFREFVEPRPSVYIPYRQFDGAALFLAVRTDMPGLGVADLVRRVVADVDRSLVVQDHGTMQAQVAKPLARPRLLASALGAYALVVVILAVAGLYAVITTSVAGRRREFGVRAALGASPRALASLVLGDGARVAASGLAVGLMASLAASRWLAALLYGVEPTDPLTLAGAGALLLGVCLGAVLVPAQRAARADPARELRAD